MLVFLIVDKGITKGQQLVYFELLLLVATPCFFVEIEVRNHQLIGVRENASVTIKPIQLTAKYRVQVLVHGQVTVAWDHFFSLLTDGIVDTNVFSVVGIEIFLSSRASKNHPSGVVKTLRSSNIGVLPNKLHHCTIFRQGKRIAHGTALDVIRLPVPTPIAVGIVVANSIFVDFTISIVVDTLLTKHFVLPNLVRAYLH